jgi:hypothetical protein
MIFNVVARAGNMGAVQRGGGGVVHGIVDIDELALGWSGRSMAAVGGRAVVVV